MESPPKFTFDELLADFPAICDTLRVGGAAPDDPHAFAQHGFQLTAPSAQYATEHVSFINTRCEGELSDDSLAGHGDAASTWRAFSCLGLGYLLGLYQNGDIDEQQFFVGDAQFAGFIFLHSPRILEFAAQRRTNRDRG